MFGKPTMGVWVYWDGFYPQNVMGNGFIIAIPTLPRPGPPLESTLHGEHQLPRRRAQPSRYLGRFFFFFGLFVVSFQKKKIHLRFLDPKVFSFIERPAGLVV